MKSQKVTIFVIFRNHTVKMMKISEFLDVLTAKGTVCFTTKQVNEALEVSDVAARAAIRRLKHKGEIAQPMQGFYVIVPPEYRILGCRPAEHFIRELMEHINTPYYVGLLSAAQYHGAAHHRPQQYQVLINQKRRAIICGRVKIVFITKKNIKDVPTQNHNTPQSIISISTPETTAMDLIIYENRCGGMDNVLAVLNDLKNKIDPKKLMELSAKSNETPWIQRLGYLFDLLNAEILSDALINTIKMRPIHQRKLVQVRLLEKFTTVDKKMDAAKSENKKSDINKKWKLLINKKLELDE